MAEPRYVCGQCGTLVCSSCGRGRPNTDIRYMNYRCEHCWGREGVLVPTMHTERMWRTHNSGDLPDPYPYGQRPEPEEWPDGFGPHTAQQPTYRGVPLPGPEQKNLVDMDAWRCGVDAALRNGD